MGNHRGLLYIAIGGHDIAHKMAMVACSIASARRNGWDGPVTVVSDANVNGELGDGFEMALRPLDAHVRFPLEPVINLKNPYRTAYGVKTQLWHYSEHDTTIYLDYDTIWMQSPDVVFNDLDGAELGLVRDLTLVANHTAYHDDIQHTLQVTGNVQQYGSGVVAWRRTNAAGALMEAWRHEWLKFMQDDQLALMRALWPRLAHSRGARPALDFRELPQRDNWVSNQHAADIAVCHFAGHRDTAKYIFRNIFGSDYLEWAERFGAYRSHSQWQAFLDTDAGEYLNIGPQCVFSFPVPEP